MCEPKTVGTVLKKAVWDMTYKEFESLHSDDYPVSKEEAQKLFAIGKGGFRIYRNAHTREVIDDKLIVTYFEKSNYIKTTLIFDNKTFPDLIDDESADFVLSEYLENPQWNCFISAFQTVWTKTFTGAVDSAQAQWDNTEEILEAKFVKPEGQGIGLEWKSNKGQGSIAIENHSEVQGCVIDTFGKSKQFVMNVLDKAMEGVILHDVKP